MSQSGGSSKPAPENRFNTGVLTGYFLGPQDLGDSKATEGAALFGQAGQGVGILPDWNDVLDLSGQSFFGNLNGPNANPIFTDALGRVFTTPEIKVDLGGIGGGMGGGYGGGGFGGKIVPSEATNNALNYLQNTPSVFDTMSGGPIVDRINQLDAQASQAFTDRAMRNLDIALEISMANDSAQGFLSADTVNLNRQRITEGVISDLNVMEAERSLSNTKYLGDLAMADIVNQSNNMKTILEQAMVEKGIDAQFASAMAAIQAEQATALAVAQINSQTQLAINSQDNALALLGMGQQDFTSSIDRRLNTMTAPLDYLAGLSGTSPIATQPASS